MYLYKRGNVWWVKFMRNYTVYRYSCHAKTKKEAHEFVEKMYIVRRAPTRADALKLVDIFFPPESGKGRIPISEAWQTYTEIQKATGLDNIAERTMRHRGQVFRRFKKFLKDKPAVKDVEDVDGPLAAAFAAYLSQQKNRKDKPISAKTRANIIAELSTIWSLLSKVSSAVGDPWKGLMPRANDGGRTEAFTPDQEHAVMDAAKKVGKGWPLACVIARHTGLRYGDVARLTWEQIDMGKRTVYAALASTPEESRHGNVLPLHAELYGNPSAAAYKQLNFREVLDAAGIGEGWTFHSWRHTFRSRLADAGVDMETAKRLCGHTQDETSRHYDHAAHLDEYKKAIDAAAKV
jgi:integrase